MGDGAMCHECRRYRCICDYIDWDRKHHDKLSGILLIAVLEGYLAQDEATRDRIMDEGCRILDRPKGDRTPTYC